MVGRLKPAPPELFGQDQVGAGLAGPVTPCRSPSSLETGTKPPLLMNTPKKSVTSDLAANRAGVVVPRRWLFAIPAIVIVPWLVAGFIYLRAPAGADEGAEAQPSAGAESHGAHGPWGKLTRTPIVVSPPLEFVSPAWGRDIGTDQWFFPGVAAQQDIDSFLAAVGIAPEHRQRLLGAASPEPKIRGFVITPDAEVVRALSPEVRAKLYLQLGKTSLNFDQANSFRFYATSPGDWLNGSLISDETRRELESLLYRDGPYLHFADPELVLARVTEPAERQRIAKVLARQSTLIVTLTIDDPGEVLGLSEYWGRGGRRTDVRPLLESLASASQPDSLDIVHLLPGFARDRLYRYPRPSSSDFDKPLLANCLWTSLNFFAGEPDDKYLDVHTSLETLRREYTIIQSDYQLGDILGMVDEEGNLFHAAVYIADDLVFTKNGTSPIAPWTIMPIQHLRDYYRLQSEDPRVIYHRRNDM